MKECKTQQEYINIIVQPVRNVCKKYGYLPSVLIAQSCLENGYGIRSYWDNSGIENLLKYNNMVGLKAQLLNKSWAKYSVWPGKCLVKNTPEEYNGNKVTIRDSFRIYDSIEQSFQDFLLFLKYASNYGEGGTPKYGEKVLSIKDPETLIRKVASLGYATDSRYPTSVMRIINKHNLTQFDNIKGEEKQQKSMIKVIQNKTIHNIISQNRSQVPASRGSNRIQYIVIHYLGVPNADNPNLYGGGYGGHFNIQRNGQIYNAADPKTAVIWHCGGGLQGNSGHTFYKKCTNFNSIGIECGVCYTENVKKADGDSNKWYFTEETQESLVWLVSKLMDDYNISFDHVIRHYDVTGKICPNPYVKNNNLNTSWTWIQFKNNLQQYRKDGTITIPSNESSKDYLIKGDFGEEVKKLQSNLISLGYSCGAAGADGSFGNGTENAVKAFQKDNNLVVDGIFGKASKAKMDSIMAEKQKNVVEILLKGSSGQAVKDMQEKLISLGYSCGAAGADGSFGNGTEKALKEFQSDNNLEADGIYGPQSKNKLEENYKNGIKKTTIGTVTASALRVRKGPGINYEQIGIIKRGTQVIIKDKVKGTDNEYWFYINVNNYNGYSSSKYINI